MTKRLQVILQDREYRQIQQAARARRISIAEWVRQALDVARRHETLLAVSEKLALLRAAVLHNGPTADIDQMLSEIAGSYLPDSRQ